MNGAAMDIDDGVFWNSSSRKENINHQVHEDRHVETMYGFKSNQSQSSSSSSGIKLAVVDDAAETTRQDDADADAGSSLDSHQKKVKLQLRRSARRRTLAPVYNPSTGGGTRRSLLVECGGKEDHGSEHGAQSDSSDSSGRISSKWNKRVRQEDHAKIDGFHRTDDNHEADLELQGRRRNVSVDVVVGDHACDCACTPPKQKRPKKNQRRRSLAVQNGTRLLKSANEAVHDETKQEQEFSDVGEGDVEEEEQDPNSAMTMSSLSNASGLEPPSSSISSQCPDQDANEPNVSHQDRIQVISSSSTTNVKECKDPKNEHKIDNDNENDPISSSLHSDSQQSQEPSQCQSQNSTTSTLSSLCNGVAALMDTTQNIPSTVTQTNKRQQNKKQKTKRSKRAASTAASAVPTRRSARIHRRKSMHFKRLPATPEPPISSKDNDDHDGDGDDGGKESQNMQVSAEYHDNQPFKSTLHVEMKQNDKMNFDHLPQDADAHIRNGEQKGGPASKEEDGAVNDMAPIPIPSLPIKKKELETKCVDRSIATTCTFENSAKNETFEPSTHSSHPIPQPLIQMGCNHDDEEDDDVIPQKKSITTSFTKINSKPKRRRRSSLGLHVGGLISLKDMEALGRETLKRSRRRSFSARDALSVHVASVTENHVSESKPNDKIVKEKDQALPVDESAEVSGMNVRDIDTKPSNGPIKHEGNEENHSTSTADMRGGNVSSSPAEANSGNDEPIPESSKATTCREEASIRDEEHKMSGEDKDVAMRSVPFSTPPLSQQHRLVSDDATMVVSKSPDVETVPITKKFDALESKFVDTSPSVRASASSPSEQDNLAADDASMDSAGVKVDFSSLQSPDEIKGLEIKSIPASASSPSEQDRLICGDTSMVVSNLSGDKLIPKTKKLKSLDSDGADISPRSACTMVSNEPESLDMTADDIKLLMGKLFTFEDINTKPCVTARLFSCAILNLTRSRGFNIQQNQPLISLLRAYVGAELASLQDLDYKNNVRKKKLHFCSFDGSSTINPIDTMVGSNEVIEGCIEKLHNVVQVVDSFVVNKDRESIAASCRAFLSVLEDLRKDAAEIAFHRCSEAMPFPWPASRFMEACKQYQKELIYVVSEMGNGIDKGHVSLVRTCLGDFIGRAIRFHLRRYFNPVPLPLYSDSDDLPDYSNTRSCVHEIVEMKGDDEGGRDTATADGSISSVIGIALQFMVHFSQLNAEIMKRRMDESTCSDDGKFVKSFFNRHASKRGLQERGCVIKLSNEDVEDIITDIEECHTFLAGIRARRFLHHLLTWPGVSEAIDDAGGWEKVQLLAQIFDKGQLAKEMPAEQHFVLLSDVDSLLNDILNESETLKSIEQVCEENLRTIWKRFRCGTRNKDLLKLNPCIKRFQAELKIGRLRTKFPYIVEATEWQ